MTLGEEDVGMFLTGKEILAQTKAWEQQFAKKTIEDLVAKVKSFEDDLKNDIGTQANSNRNIMRAYVRGRSVPHIG